MYKTISETGNKFNKAYVIGENYTFNGSRLFYVVLQMHLYRRTQLSAFCGLFIRPSLLFPSGCMVDGQRFHGRGKDRRIAKARAAEAALTELFEMDFSSHQVDAIPYIPIVTDDQQVSAVDELF